MRDEWLLELINNLCDAAYDCGEWADGDDQAPEDWYDD